MFEARILIEQDIPIKYVFPAAKIIKTARYVIMKLSENYPNRTYMKTAKYKKYYLKI